MDSFKIQLDNEKNKITVKYSGLVQYRTLLKSLEELLDICMVERVHAIFDFSEVRTMPLCCTIRQQHHAIGHSERGPDEIRRVLCLESPITAGPWFCPAVMFNP